MRSLCNQNQLKQCCLKDDVTRSGKECSVMKAIFAPLFVVFAVLLPLAAQSEYLLSVELGKVSDNLHYAGYEKNVPSFNLSKNTVYSRELMLAFRLDKATYQRLLAASPDQLHELFGQYIDMEAADSKLLYQCQINSCGASAPRNVLASIQHSSLVERIESIDHLHDYRLVSHVFTQRQSSLPVETLMYSALKRHYVIYRALIPESMGASIESTFNGLCTNWTPSQNGIAFEVNQAELRLNNLEALYCMAQYLSDVDDDWVSIAGHADASGSSATNQQLALERSRNMAMILLNEFKVEGLPFSAVSYGEQRLLTALPVGDARHRRVEISLTQRRVLWN